MGWMRVNSRRLLRAIVALAIIAGIGIAVYAWRQSYSHRVAVLVGSVQQVHRPWYLAWLGPAPPPPDLAAIIEALIALGPPAEAAIADQLKNPDDDSRFCAAAALTEIGTNQSVPALIEAVRTYGCPVDDGSLVDVVMMCQALGRIGDPRASDILLESSDKVKDLSFYFGPRAYALARIGEPRLAVPLIRSINSKRGFTGQVSRPDPMMLRIVRLHGYAGVQAILENPDPRIARTAARVLDDYADEQVVNAILQLIKEGKVSYRYGDDWSAVFTQYRAYDDWLPVSAQHCGDLLCRMAMAEPGGFYDDSPFEAVRLMRFIADDRQVLQTLRRLAEADPLKDRYVQCRPLKAAEILAEARPREGGPILRKVMAKIDPDGQMHISPEYLEAMNDIPGLAAAEALMDNKSYEYTEKGVACEQSILTSRDARTVPVLVSLLAKHSVANPCGRRLVLGILWRFRQAELSRGNPGQVNWDEVERLVVNHLAESLKRNHGGEDVIESLGMCSKEVVTPVLLAELEKWPDDVRILELVARLQMKDAIPLCLQTAQSSENGVDRRQQAIKYLGQVKAPQAIEIALAGLDEPWESLGPASCWSLIHMGYHPAAEKVLAMLREHNARPQDEQQAMDLANYVGPDQALDLLEHCLDGKSWPGWQDGMILAVADQRRDRCIQLLMKRVWALPKSHIRESSNNKLKCASMRILGRLKASQAVDLLASEVEDPWTVPETALAAIEALGDIAAPEAIAVIKTKARSGYAGAIRQLIRLKQPDALDLMLLCDDVDFSGMDAPTLFEAMRLSGDLPAACDSVAKWLTDNLAQKSFWRHHIGILHANDVCYPRPFPRELAEALDLAGDARGAELTGQWLATGLEDSPEHTVHQAAVERLGQMQNPAAGKVLRGLLSDMHRSVRCFAARELGKRRDRQAIPLLQKMLKHPDARLQYAARQAIRRIEGPATTQAAP